MEQVFSYIISLGASVMMPIIFTVIGLCIGMKFGKALKSGLFVGVGFVWQRECEITNYARRRTGDFLSDTGSIPV